MGSCFSTTQLKNLTLFTFRRSPREWPLQRIRSNVILSPELTLKACNTHEYIIQYNLDLNLSSMFVLDTYLLVFGIILQEWKKMCRNIESPQIQILLGLPVIHSLPSIINLSCASYESSGINLVTFANSTCRLANSGHM
eukprot:m.68172 g.68172  ORF g.68172 m.68172 type:complete len:139 (+) comp11946_c0_seq2:305-721(+)